MTEMGAPDGAEIAAFQERANEASMAVIRANAAVAEAREALAYREAEAAGAQTAVARLNVEGALLQQRVNFAQSATKAAASIVRSGAIPGLRR
jgi:hypothetical protein